MLAGTLGGLLATWCTFVPGFLFIGLGAPFIERLRDNRALAAALGAITAAVVGVILNLALWFALHALFATVEPRSIGIGTIDMPDWATVNIAALVLTIGAVAAVFRFKAGTLTVLAVCAGIGMALRLGGIA